MTASGHPAASGWRAPRALRPTVLAVAAVQTAFWIYTWYYIIGHANPKGDGMELIAVVPLTFIFLIFVLPAFFMGLAGRAFRTALILLLVGFAANFFLWTEILSEFAAHGR